MFYAAACFCEIFSIGGFLATQSSVLGFIAAHVAILTTTFWILLYNAILTFQWFDDDGLASACFLSISSVLVFVPTLYVALDTGFGFTRTFWRSYYYPYNNVALFVLCLLLPLVCLVASFIFYVVLLLKKLREKKPLSEY